MKKIIELWNKLKMWQQILIVLVVIGAAFSLFFVNTKPDPYNLLFSELDAKESVKIGTELSKMGVDYKLQDTNTTIMVKTTDVAQIRMELASKGLPSVSGSGFELFDGNQLGTSNFENSVNYTRAVTSTIQETLVSGIDSIDDAKVQIPLIEKKRFYEQDEKDEPLTAKVIIQEKTGQELTSDQVKGIQNFVAGAAQNLKAENVTVLNSKAEIISDNDADGTTTGVSSAGYSKERQIIQQTENGIKSDITKTLSGVFGYDNIKLTVRTNINFDEIAKNIEKYDPKGTLVSRNKSTEKSRNTTSGDTEAGTESNGDVPDYEMKDGTNGEVSAQDKDNLIENFEVGKTVETVRQHPELQDILVSVYVDEKEISVDKLQDLKENIALSAGLIDKDGNGEYDNGQITVKTYEFKKDTADTSADSGQVKSVQNFLKNNKILLMILGALLVIVIILIFLIAFISSKKKQQDEKNEQLIRQERAYKRAGSEAKMNQEEEEEPFVFDVKTSKEEIATQRLIEESLAHAKEDTNKTIEYIRNSLNER